MVKKIYESILLQSAILTIYTLAHGYNVSINIYIDLLKSLKIGVAMGNAPKAVKDATMYVTSSNDENGICYALGNFLD